MEQIELLLQDIQNSLLIQRKSTGGEKTKATQNMPYEILTPIVQTVTPRGTNVQQRLERLLERVE